MNAKDNTTAFHTDPAKGLNAGFHYFQMGRDAGSLNTCCFEILLFFAIFSLFVVREKDHFWHSAPSKTLLLPLVADMGLGILFPVSDYWVLPLFP